MKFTCDSCGAQYMIGDEKLGKRGVKVRCKKCSYVIILRPPGFVADKRPLTGERPARELMALGDGDDDRAGSDDLSPDAPFESDGAPFDEGERTGQSAVIQPTYRVEMSDEAGTGLTEAAALVAMQDATLASEHSVIGDGSGESSPFNHGPVGGSLTDGRMNSMTAPIEIRQRADDEEEATRTEHNAFAPDVPDLRPHDGIEDPVTRKLNLEQLKATEGRIVDEAINADDEVVAERIARLENRDEVGELQSSLNDTLAGGRWGEASVERTERTAAPSSPKPNFASLAQLAAQADDRIGPGIGMRPAVVASMTVTEMPRIDAPIDSEIKSAFEAMFSPSSVTGPPLSSPSKNGNGGHAEGAPMELFRSAYNEPQETKEQDPNETTAPSPATADGLEWYVAVDEEQVGPMSLDDVRARWQKGDVGPESLCWKTGMADWSPVREVAELAGLGDMSTVRPARLEVADSAEVAAKDPPVIRMQEVQMPAPSAGDEDSSWRPSAASALASLAAQELDPSTEPKREAKKEGKSEARALPVTSDALEKILKGDDAKPSPFGAMEQSSSAIRPLPKSADLKSSISLRDPVEEMRRPSFVLPAAILASAVLVVGAMIFFALRSPAPAVETAAKVENTQVAGAGLAKPNEVVARLDEPAPAAAPEPTKALEAPPTPVVDVPKTEGVPPEVAKLEQKTQPDGNTDSANAKAAIAEGEDEDKRGKRKDREKRESRASRDKSDSKTDSKGDRSEKSDSRKTESRSEKKVDDDDVEVVSSDEDLLGGATKKRPRPVEAPSNDLPKQLDDSDILGELRKHKAQIQGCRQKQKAADPAVEGTMTINFVIEGSGKTRRWSVEPARFKTSAAGKCVVDAVKSWNFPKFSGSAMPVDFPVSLGGG